MTEKQVFSIVAGVIGVAIHTCMAYKSNEKLAHAANLKLTVNDFWRNDGINIILAFLSVMGWFVIFDEVAKRAQILSEFVITSYLALGALGSYAIQYGFGKSKAIIRKSIDRKTDQLDAILNNNNNNMDIWEVKYTHDMDLFNWESNQMSAEDFAVATNGQWDSSTKTVSYEHEPEFASVEIWAGGVSTSTYFAEPKRRPR